ncbi:hypothetical protein EVAR_84446_1 [Eumeta japonica]|uniref:Reverse transcriptase domain-containing protein n=1 Tax=Eumeta variegata TaxID=151549 RepID=A0A4C1W4C1_EUMVA|nr:hypothetical protein EVAR_84446_1 [Eumeta japonica]
MTIWIPSHWTKSKPKSKKLNTRKAPDLDGISNKAIKCFSLLLMALLVAIFKACLKNCYFSPRAGVSQGSMLLPLLYSAFINDIPQPQTGEQLTLFANDTTLYCSIRHIIPRLQRAIDELTQ